MERRIKIISLDAENTLNSTRTDAEIEHLCRYLAGLSDQPYEFWLEAYQKIRSHVKETEWQTAKCYDIRYRLEKLFERLGTNHINLDECVDEYYRAADANTTIYPEVPGFIKSLKSRGYLVGITTDSTRISKDKVPSWLHEAGIKPDGLDFIVSPDRTYNLSKRQGHPFDILINDAYRLGIANDKPGIIPGEILHIGDNEQSDLLVPSRKGIHALLFDPRKSSFADLLEEIDKLEKRLKELSERWF